MTGERSDAKLPETIDSATGRPDPTPRRIDLSSLRDVRIELAALYRRVDANEIPSQDGTRRAYILRQIADVLALAELEGRIEQLEQRQAEHGALAYRH